MAERLEHTGTLSPAHPGLMKPAKPPLYVSAKNETVRMFDSDFMEFFSRVHPAIPLILYLPVVGFMLYVAIWRQGFPVFVVVGLFLLGMLLWTLLEYLIHRYIFHYEPKTRVCECAARIPFLRHVPANLRALFVQRVRRIGVWLCLLRHAPLRDAPFSDETRRITLAEAVSSSPSLQR